MPDLYSSSDDRLPSQPLRVAASAELDAAPSSIVVAYWAESQPAVLNHALKAARDAQAALRVIVYTSDNVSSPTSNAVQAPRRLIADLESSGVQFEVQRPDSDVASQVLDLAEDVEASLIVVSTRRRSPMLKLLMGSVVQRIILEADAPVLVVK